MKADKSPRGERQSKAERPDPTQKPDTPTTPDYPPEYPEREEEPIAGHFASRRGPRSRRRSMRDPLANSVWDPTGLVDSEGGTTTGDGADAAASCCGQKTRARRLETSTTQTSPLLSSSPRTVATSDGTVTFRDADPLTDLNAFVSNRVATDKQEANPNDIVYGRAVGLTFGQNLKKAQMEWPNNWPMSAIPYAAQEVQRERGRALLASFPDAVKSVRKGDWRVRSASGSGRYRVVRMAKGWACECPASADLTPAFCKHVWAVRISLLPNEFGAAPKSRVLISRPPQDWGAYDRGQMAEHPMFDVLLWRLLEGVEEPETLPSKPGRKPVPLRTQILLAVKKVHSGLGCRRARGRAITEFRGGAGVLPSGGVPCYATASRLFNRPGIAEVLLDLVQRSAQPLRDIEDQGTVAVDSSGFVLTRFFTYRNRRSNGPADPRKHEWLKAHIVIGVKTHAVLNVVVSDLYCADTTQFVPLLEGMAKAGFTPKTVVADKAYPSRTNCSAADRLGIEPIIPFLNSATGQSRGSRAYSRMYHLFLLHREDFDRRYHQRSNVESVFFAIKAKLGELVRSVKPEAQVAELLAKILAYNLTVLVHEIFEHGIDPDAIGLSPRDEGGPSDATEVAA